jgi:hypothetical protein
MRGRRTGSLLCVVFAIAVVAGPSGLAAAFEGGGARTSNLQRDLRVERPRTLREPRAAAYDLKNLQRRLHEQRVEAPRDPRVPALEIEARHLRWQADRAARRTEPGARLPANSALATGAPVEKPRYLGGSHTPLGASSAGLDFGRRVVALQNDLAEIEARLAQGETMAAAELLAAAEADLYVLRGALSDAVANDPNLLALEAQLGVLRQRSR